MSVTVARSSGFCWGVRRAVDLVLAELKRGKGPFRVVGPLVHNPLVLEALAERGVECCEDPCTTDGGVLFLRTHGTTLEERRILSENESVKIKDLTCPRVGRALSVAGSRRAEGHDVIILGDPGHQEVRALRSYAGGESSFVIQGPSDVAALPPLGNPFLLSQTTQDYELFDRTVEALLDRFPNLRWENTICESTSSRQEELRRLFPNADCVVVVGGRDSANTARLAAIAGDHGLPAMLVEKAEDLDPAVIGAFRRIVLTAGASTPSWAIRRVLGRLQEIQGTRVRAAYRILRNLVFANWHILVTALLIGLAGGAMTGRSAMSRLLPSVVSALVLFALHNFVEEGALCPLISDSSGSVLSFPPVINSEGTGRVSVGDRDLFCEVTGTDWNTVGLTASILACNLEDRGFRIEPVEIGYPRETPDGGSVSITPRRFCDTLSTTRERISTVLGILPDDAAIERSLAGMGWDSWTIDGAVVEARMPPYRHDGMHEVDLIEDIAVGYGLNRFEPLMPEGYTIGASAAIEDLADAVRIMLAGAGCEEVLLPILTSEGRPGTPPGIVRIENPMTLEYGAVRNSLIPGLLGVEAVSSHTPYPHRVFEVGEVLENGSGDLRTVVRLAVSISGNDAGFGDVHSVIGLICHGRGHSLALTPSGDDRFIPGRSCTLMVDGREAGVMGEVHPSILDELGITRPVAAFELDLESLGGAVQG
ncbi:MAG TPA: 4-hydroxy-3-methylbut-2-enyl diphosphate reductase [Candidatus Fermentibacter daniensis]|nr:4-hydroxy-3-methylbut-2-enyl diphosphate reductase [Candidatus Fermentibacter daniensis]HPN63324.1 4-hydroxy-3-methylbut-2-enyl diphosphate reductase [Candidatus Fermentibacter daniensis]